LIDIIDNAIARHALGDGLHDVIIKIAFTVPIIVQMGSDQVSKVVRTQLVIQRSQSNQLLTGHGGYWHCPQRVG
jgi:hypothetical protein